MVSTFHGLETAKRGMFTQQNALYVTSHNIANANTPGYTRQRVNFLQTEAYPAAGMNAPMIPGQLGTGVQAGSIERIRESFLDVQYRNEQNKLGYWESKASSLSKMEDIMNEPTENGLSAVMGEFWQSLQDLATYPENEGTRQVTLERGQAVADTFHFLSESLTTIKNDIGNEVSVNLKEINSILKQIAELNKQIGDVEPHGYLPNDLYDQRDLLVDQLSNHLDIKVEKVQSGGKPQEMAEGQYIIKLNGTDVNLVDKKDFVQLGFEGTDGTLSYDIPPAIGKLTVFDEAGNQVQEDPSLTIDIVSGDEVIFPSGKLRGLIEAYGYQMTDGSVKGTYPDMLDNLDKYAFSFASLFNEIHSEGYSLKGDTDISGFFVSSDTAVVFSEKTKYKGAAQAIQLGNLNPSDIAISTKKNANGVEAGDGKNALNLANIANMLLTNTEQKLEGLPDVSINLQEFSVIDTGTLNFFYEGVIGQLGVDAMQANRLTNNSTILRDSVETNRQSISSVSLDEEMTNLIQYQHAYSAAARQITVIDEILDKVINGMGTGGR